MALRAKLLGAAAGLLAGLQAATQYVGWSFAWAGALGPGWAARPDLVVYPPWSIIGWRLRFAAEEPKVFAAAIALLLLGLTGGLGLGAMFDGPGRTWRVRGWGSRQIRGNRGLCLLDIAERTRLKGSANEPLCQSRSAAA